jgi:hypothetical protein
MELLVIALVIVGVVYFIFRNKEDTAEAMSEKVQTVENPSVIELMTTSVNDQITDSVTQSQIVESSPTTEVKPVKKPRKPRAPKTTAEVEKSAVKKAPTKTAAAVKSTAKTKSKKT